MKRIAIVYSSQNGHTAKIAKRMAEHLSKTGHQIKAFNVYSEFGPTSSDLLNYDTMFIGGSVYFGEYDERLIDWMSANYEELNRTLCGIFSVSLHSGSKLDRASERGRDYLQRLVGRTGLMPAFATDFAGATPYSKLGRFRRFLLRRICASAGRKTDVKDREMTDWTQVQAFADAVADRDILSSFAIDLGGFSDAVVDGDVPSSFAVDFRGLATARPLSGM